MNRDELKEEIHRLQEQICTLRAMCSHEPVPFGKDQTHTVCAVCGTILFGCFIKGKCEYSSSDEHCIHCGDEKNGH